MSLTTNASAKWRATRFAAFGAGGPLSTDSSAVPVSSPLAPPVPFLPAAPEALSIAIDRETNHAPLPFHLGQINMENGFDVVTSRPPLAADPYLTGRNKPASPKLRVVS